MKLEKVVMLAAPSARSQAYLQTLVARNLLPDRLILMGAPGNTFSPESVLQSDLPDLILPNLGESLSTTCARADIPVVELQARNVNSAEVAAAIKESHAEVIIYSGYGGQIVADSVLTLGPEFLHLHSGSLPDYRGSTTLYYALLNGDSPAVTAILLDKQIDTGPVVARRKYPKPPANIDVDNIYDAAIRADLLWRVLEEYAACGRLQGERQLASANVGPYYVIHPVLKHLALLSLSSAPSQDG